MRILILNLSDSAMATSDRADSSARPPLQARSRATFDRLLDATAALLAEKPFDEASVAEIVDRAGTSVGAFYGRFPDKDSLLDCFDERFFVLARASCDEFFDSAGWRQASLHDSVAQLVSLLVCNHRRYRGVLRALTLRALARPGSPFRERADRHNRYVLERVKAHLLTRPEPVGHPDPARACPPGHRQRASPSGVTLDSLIVPVGFRRAPSWDAAHGQHRFSSQIPGPAPVISCAGDTSAGQDRGEHSSYGRWFK